MKKLILTALVAIAFLACSEKPYQAINNSDYEVTFVIDCNANCTYTLKPHKSIDIDEELNIKSFSATPPRVLYKIDNDILEFYNTPERQIKIINSIDRIISLTALGCMDNEPKIVLPNSEIEETIYSDNLVFNCISADGFPVKYTISLDRQSLILHW